MSNSLQPHGWQQARLPSPSPSPRACSNSCPLNQWCHPTISSSVIPFSSCLQSFPASGYFPMSQFFASGGQSIGSSTSASVLPVNSQSWFPFRLIVLISLLSKGLSRVFSSTTAWKHQFFSASLLYGPTLTPVHDFGWTLGVGDGQGGLGCCSPWGHKESDMTERLNWTESLAIITYIGVWDPLKLDIPM